MLNDLSCVLMIKVTTRILKEKILIVVQFKRLAVNPDYSRVQDSLKESANKIIKIGICHISWMQQFIVNTNEFTAFRPLPWSPLGRGVPRVQKEKSRGENPLPWQRSSWALGSHSCVALSAHERGDSNTPRAAKSPGLAPYKLNNLYQAVSALARAGTGGGIQPAWDASLASSNPHICTAISMRFS
jgi:hypothetical protein